MENILNSINGRCVSLSATEQKRNNVIVHAVLNTVLQSLNTDNLFKAFYSKIFFGGSYYDNLKVGDSNEFDIDLLFVLPENISPTINPSDKTGYVHVTLSDLEKLEEKFKGLEKLCNPKTKQISAKKFLSWFESLSTKCFNKLCPGGKVLQTVSVQGKEYDIKVKLTKSGPASTINIVAEALDRSVIKIYVDLVPCISFSKKFWPSESTGYRQYDSNLHGNSETFFVVSKLPTGTDIPDFYWRLSFQEQERVLISGNELGRLKSSLRLLKKVRDRWNHPICSYFIKTVYLWEVETRSKDFWNRPLSIILCGMLEVYGEKLKNGSIPYFWNEKFNLISDYKKSTLESIANKINNIVSDVKRFAEMDPFVVAKHIVSEEEVEILRKEVTIGKKLRGPIETSSKLTVSNFSSYGTSRADNVVSSSTSSSSASKEISHCSPTPIGTLILDKLFESPIEFSVSYMASDSSSLPEIGSSSFSSTFFKEKPHPSSMPIGTLILDKLFESPIKLTLSYTSSDSSSHPGNGVSSSSGSISSSKEEHNSSSTPSEKPIEEKINKLTDFFQSIFLNK